MPEKKLSKILNGRCRGYKIDGKFRSLSFLEKRRFPYAEVIFKPEYLPF